MHTCTIPWMPIITKHETVLIHASFIISFWFFFFFCFFTDLDFFVELRGVWVGLCVVRNPLNEIFSKAHAGVTFAGRFDGPNRWFSENLLRLHTNHQSSALGSLHFKNFLSLSINENLNRIRMFPPRRGQNENIRRDITAEKFSPIARGYDQTPDIKREIGEKTWVWCLIMQMSTRSSMRPLKWDHFSFLLCW